MLKQCLSEIIRDKQEFIEKANLSKTRNEEDVEIYISPVKLFIGNGTTISRDDTKQELYYGKIKNIKKYLISLKKSNE